MLLSPVGVVIFKVFIGDPLLVVRFQGVPKEYSLITSGLEKSKIKTLVPSDLNLIPPGEAIIISLDFTAVERSHGVGNE